MATHLWMRVSTWLSTLVSVRPSAVLLVATSLAAWPATAIGQVNIRRVDGIDGLTVGQGATGTSWALAYKHLQDAIDEANLSATQQSPYQIWIRGENDADGWTYYPDEGDGRTNNDPDEHFVMDSFVAIYGGFAGTEGGNPTGFRSRDVTKYKVVVSGDIDQDGLDTGNSHNIFKAHLVGPSAILDGVTITGGYADGGGTDQDRGAAILITGGTTSSPGNESEPVILRVRFTANYATFGGAVYIRSNQNSEPEFRNCTFENNEAVTAGGAIEVDDLGGIGSACAPFVINCLFHDNEGGGNGSAVHTDDYCTVTFRHCTVTQNHSDGAAIAHDVAASAEPPTRTGENKLFSCIVYDNTNDGSPSTSLAAQLAGAAAIETSCIQNLASPYPSGSGNISSDPNFADPSNNDFRPECGSPVIGAADDTDVQATHSI